MLDMRFDIKRIKALKELIIRLRDGESLSEVRVDYNEQFHDAGAQYILLMEQELIHNDDEITVEDVGNFLAIHDDLFDYKVYETFENHHPVTIFLSENRACQSLLNRTDELLQQYEKNQLEDVSELQQLFFQLGEFHKHYHKKEKLMFPIMERYGYYMPTRLMWREDDRIRAFYQGAKRHISELPNIVFSNVQTTYSTFRKAFTEMIFQEEKIILPILVEVFTEEDWATVANESDAFGYTLIEQEATWQPTSTLEKPAETNIINIDPKQDIRFGGGYLSIEEANLILNSLPLEITYVDKNSVFKYFNKITEASDMMLVRTPTSIGRNVANCHPPKSLRKVMTLIRDLKTKKRTQESMWFKKGNQYVHLTYKAIFNEDDEFLGILEYVQDIQPFFELPTEIKRGLTNLEE